MVGAINLLVDANGGRRVPQDVVDAFNAWRMETYNSHRRQIDAQPERYGKVDWDKDPVFAGRRRFAERGPVSGGKSPAPIAGSTAASGWDGN